MKFCPQCDFSTQVAGAGHCPYDGTRLQVDRLIGRSIEGRLLVEERIGTGAMGAVYRAFQPSMQRFVAVKVMRTDLPDAALFSRRFLDEVRAVSKVEHPNVVCIYDFGQTADGLLWMAMELVDGEPLSDILARTPLLSPARIRRILSQVCDSLGAAHLKGVLHGDLKPENIMVSQPGWADDVIKVFDFGLAKFVSASNPSANNRDGTVSGTPEYMSPECALGQPVDVRSDLYALGVLLYELLNGKVPFTGDSARDVMVMQVKCAAAPLKGVGSDPLATLAMTSIDKRPDGRPQTVQAFKAALTGQPAPALTPGQRRVRAERRLRKLTTADATPLPTSLSSPQPRRWWLPAGVLILALLFTAILLWATAEKVPLDGAVGQLPEVEHPIAPPHAPAPDRP